MPIPMAKSQALNLHEPAMRLRYFGPMAVLLCVFLLTCKPYEVEVDHSEAMNFLQLETSVAGLLPHTQSELDSVSFRLAALGSKCGWLSKVLVVLAYAASAGTCLWLMCCGFPSKRPRDDQMMGSTRLLVFLGTVQLFAYFTTDQYVPSLPQMGLELRGTQTQMSGSIQMNLFVKSLVGMIVAPMSDHIGRKPILVMCLTLLILGSLACALAPDVNWFLAARVIQSLGESMEGMRLAIIRDCFQDEKAQFQETLP